MILFYQNDVFDNQKEIEIAKQYFDVVEFDSKSFYNKIPKDKFIYRGSVRVLEFLEMLNLEQYFPLSISSNYKCSYYYNLFNNIINRDCLLIPNGLVLTNCNTICDAFKTDTLFVKPNEGYKAFTGQRIGKRWFVNEWEAITKQCQIGLYDDDLILFSSSKEIGLEYRGVIGPDGYLTSSIYNNESSIESDPNIEEKIKADFPKNYYSISIDPFFVVDYCDKGMIELNSWSCSGFYDCNLDVIYDSVYEYLGKKNDYKVQRDSGR
jgi:hypothetical protein